VLASVAKPTASTHHVKFCAMNRTRAPRRPWACGRSTRIGYQFCPSPTIMATSLHVTPESGEN